MRLYNYYMHIVFMDITISIELWNRFQGLSNMYTMYISCSLLFFCYHFDALQSDKLHTKDSIPLHFIFSPFSLYTLHVILLKEILQATMGFRIKFVSSVIVHFISSFVFTMLHDQNYSRILLANYKFYS